MPKMVVSTFVLNKYIYIKNRVGIEHTTGESLNPYLAATSAAKPPPPQPVKEEPTAQAASLPAIAGSDSDSDSN